MARRHGNLKPAHSGYRYQDIATAYMLVNALVHNYDEVTVDKKQTDDDKFDDLEVKIGGERIRRQFKSSQNPDRALCIADFLSNRSSVRFDKLVLTHIRDNNSPIEHRLCATWTVPVETDELWKVLKPVNVEPTFLGSSPIFFRIDVNKIWPENNNPLWPVLDEYNQVEAEFSRAEVVDFCSKFLIEIKLPMASSNLDEPAEFENFLLDLLITKVGIGKYPNIGRNPIDVAALAVALATSARTEEQTLYPQDIERHLDIRTDYGRIAQSFPLDKTVFHNRPAFRSRLIDNCLQGGLHLVIAPPGGGKSWELTCVVEELHERNVVVAKHYCYLDPGDEFAERRVTTDTFFGNLLAEIYDAAPELRLHASHTYSADLDAFEEVIKKAPSILCRPLILIVDGLDHIARVKAISSSLSDDETSIIEMLATIDIPSGVTLILGSQPGAHLDVLRDAKKAEIIEHDLPKWNNDEVVALAKLHGVMRAFSIARIDGEDAIAALSILAEKSDGNPLYSRYLATGLVSGLAEGSIHTPADWLNGSPQLKGDIALYYSHLYKSASREAKSFADLLGVIEFSVSESELRLMIPFLSDWVLEALTVLRPVLCQSVGQGGYRIFHESFRRFMLDEIKRQNRKLNTVLQPVVQWLEECGFFESAKSYRFLFSALRRSGENNRILDYLKPDFVAQSVAFAHPVEAVERNIGLAAKVASDMLNWPALVKLCELRRTAFNYYDSNEYWIEFAETYIEIHGASALAERLIFDGRVTQSQENGLIACSMIDDAGGVAPWSEYLKLFSDESNSDFDDEHDLDSLTAEEKQCSAFIHGLLRLGQNWRVIKWFYNSLITEQDELSTSLIRNIANRISRVLSTDIVEQMISRSFSRHAQPARISKRVASLLQLGIADYFYVRGDIEKASEVANDILSCNCSSLLATDCLDKGGKIELANKFAEDPAQIDIAVDYTEYINDPTNIQRWMSSLRLLSSNQDWESIKNREMTRLEGIGWYRCWLRFVVKLADAEAHKRTGNQYDMIPVFAELVRDASPFSGKPRACDLYQICGLIELSIANSLKMIESSKEWTVALKTLVEVCEETGSRLDREDGGPLPFRTLITLLVPYINNKAGGSQVKDAIKCQVESAHFNGTYYSTHAEYEMMLARTLNRQGDKQGAQNSWLQASIYLTAYGFRKDITLFEVINSAHVLKNVSEDSFYTAMCNLQTLTEVVQRHTDGRSTKRSPNAWFSKLAESNLVLATKLLAKTILEKSSAVDNWVNIDALEDIAKKASVVEASPILIDALWATIPFNVEYDNEGENIVKERLQPIKHLLTQSKMLAQISFNRVAAEASGDNIKNINICLLTLQNASSELGISLPHIIREDKQNVSTSNTSDNSLNKKQLNINLCQPPFPPNSSYVQILSAMRGFSTKNETYFKHVSFSLSYYLSELIDSGEKEKARQLVVFFARRATSWFSTNIYPLAELAQMLENAGYIDLSVTAYALAYTSSRGNGGWSSFGDNAHSYVLSRAIELDRELALETVAEEVAYRLKELDYGAGLTENLIERISGWGEHGAAKASWDAAYDVISLRLPEPAPLILGNWFSSLAKEKVEQEWTIDEALISLILCRMREPRLSRKIAALSGFVKAVRYHPESVAKPLLWWLSRDTHTTSVLIVFQSLFEAEEAPFSITHKLNEILTYYARCDIWGVRYIVSAILQRAGLAVPANVNNKDSDIHDDSNRCSDKKIGILLSVDKGDSLKFLSDLWPELPYVLANSFNSEDLMKAESPHRDRIVETIKLAYGGRKKLVPQVPVLCWHEGLFISLLHDELNGISHYLSKNDLSHEEVEPYIAGCTIPNISIHLALHASRTLRPEGVKPKDVINGIGDLQYQSDDDPLYPSWIKLASFEEKFVRPRNSEITVTYKQYRGIISHSNNQQIPEDIFPFSEGHVDDWYDDNCPVVIPLNGALFGLCKVNDWLGTEFLLTPLALLGNLKAEKPKFGEPLKWYDINGEPILVLRSGKVRDPEVYGEEAVGLQGMDVIARPDILQHLKQLSTGDLKEMYVTTYKEIKI